MRNLIKIQRNKLCLGDFVLKIKEENKFLLMKKKENNNNNNKKKTKTNKTRLVWDLKMLLVALWLSVRNW